MLKYLERDGRVDMFGGQSHVNFDNDMAKFVPATREKITNELKETAEIMGVEFDAEKLKGVIAKRVEKKVSQAMQGVCYNLNSMHSRAGKLIAL